MILAAILDFVEEAEKRQKNVQGKFPRANICILQVFRNNPSRGGWLYYQILMMANMSKTEIYAKIMKHKKITVFIISITAKAFQLTARVRSFL